MSVPVRFRPILRAALFAGRIRDNPASGYRKVVLYAGYSVRVLAATSLAPVFLMSPPTQIHASCVAAGFGSVLIRGSAGSGKSALALSLMALGGRLVADDRTIVELSDGWPCAFAPGTIRGLVESRGVGLLATVPQLRAWVTLVVDLDRTETDRMPPCRQTEILGRMVPLLLRVECPQFAPAILQCLKGRRLRT